MASLISLSILQYSKTCFKSFFWSSISNIVKLDFKLTKPECFLKNLANMEWKVPTHGVSILLWSSVFTLSLISLAALFVKVTAIILLKLTFKFLTI